MAVAAIGRRVGISSLCVTVSAFKIRMASYERKIEVLNILPQEGHRFSFDLIVKYNRSGGLLLGGSQP